MDRFRKDLIDSHLSKLGFKAENPVRHAPLRALYAQRDYTAMAAYVRKTMRLSMRLRIGLVNNGGLPSHAWINLPDPMPMFGTRQFEQTVVTMYLRKSFLQSRSFESIIATMAHELAHIVLTSTAHACRKSEEATDLTAMLLGYRDFYRLACPLEDLVDTDTYVTTGYLSPLEVTYAANVISTL